MSAAKKIDPIAVTADRLVDLHRRLEQLRAQNSAVFDLHDRLCKEKEREEAAMKELSRPLSVLSKRVTVVETQDIAVYVDGKVAGPEYDYVKAKGIWPAHLLREVSSIQIDAGKVAGLIQAGLLDLDKAVKAEHDRKVLTPAVTIRYRKTP